MVGIASGKGGVGKSALTANLAAALATDGQRVGALDADLNGPSLARMLGVVGARLGSSEDGIAPPVGAAGVKVVSMELFQEGADAPLRWRGGEKLTVKNGDPVLHNINATPTTNRGFNRSQPQQGMTFETQCASSEVMIPVRCDVHGWMSAFIGVTDNPYHVVSGADGTFSLDRLPPGTYTLEAWHEKYGTATQSVTVATGQTAEVTFEFNGKVAADVPMGPVLLVDMHSGTARRISTPVQQ